MRRILSVIALIPFPFALPAAPQPQPPADPGLMRFMHPDAKVVAGAELPKLMRSELGRFMQQPFGSALRGELGGLDLAGQIESILLSSPGGGTGQPRFVVALRGKFPAAKLREMVLRQGGLSRRYAGVELLEPGPDSGEEAWLALVDPQTMLAGDPESVLDVVERRAAGGGEPPLAGRARDLAGRYDLWLLVESLDALPAQGAVPSPLLADVRGLEGGLTARAGIEASLRLNMASAESAGVLAATLAGFGKLAPAGDLAGELLNKLSVTPQGGAVQLRLVLDARQAQQMALGLAGSMLAGRRSLGAWVSPAPRAATPAPPVAVAAVRGAQAAPPAEPPAEPERKVIRIVGLEEGTREIPYQEPR